MPLYRYELRRGEEIVATGRLTHEQPLQVGETLMLGNRSGLVRSIEPRLHEPELQVLVQLRREND